jgi:hypothetical protein
MVSGASRHSKKKFIPNLDPENIYPGSGSRIRIPDPEGKKTPDPGSPTLPTVIIVSMVQD